MGQRSLWRSAATRAMIVVRSFGERSRGCDAIVGELVREVTSMARLRAARDPFWDMDGNGVRRERRRGRILSTTALILAATATGLVLAAWIRELAPVLGTVGLG